MKYRSPRLHLTDNAETAAPREPDPGTPYAAGVPLVKLIKRQLVEVPELAVFAQPRSIVAEKFRTLKTLLVNRIEGPIQVVVVTSGAPAEGKSTIAANLALSFATDHDQKTLLIDADLRRPTIRSWIQPEPVLGLSDVLSGQVPLDHAKISLENTPLEVLPAGKPVRNPTELLGSDATRELLSRLRADFTRIVIDTPPTIPFSDADILGVLGDGVILVARAGTTPVRVLEQAMASVTSRILLTVLNYTLPRLADSRYDQAYYNSYYERSE